MILHLSKTDEEGCSMNGWLDFDEFPTTYFATLWVFQFVSVSPMFLPASPPIIITLVAALS